MQRRCIYIYINIHIYVYNREPSDSEDNNMHKGGNIAKLC